MSKQPIVSDEQALPPVAAVAGARMAGEERRLQILRVAVRLFSQHGFRGTTTKEIAQAACVSEAMVFRHFATKQELYAAILDHKVCVGVQFQDPRGMLAEAVRLKDDHAVFETLAYEALQHHEQDPEFQRLLMHSALEEHELARMFWERTVLQIYDFLGSYIRERQQDGAFRDANPLTVVRALMGMIIHHSLNNNLWDKQRSLLNISNRQAAREFTCILLNGILTGGEAGAEKSGRKKRAPLADTKKRKR